MKTGKYFPLGYHKNVKIGYGTVDFKNLKTIYVKFNSWIEPNEEEDYDDIIRKTRRNIKQYFLFNKSEKFKKEIIVDLDIRTKGIKLDKKSFMNLEITLYTEKQFDIKSIENRIYIKNITKKIIDDFLSDKRLFNFYKHKKPV